MKLNFNLPHIPFRPEKKREIGINMIMDKGLSIREAENMIESSGDYIDLVKLGFGTSLITKNLTEKIRLYKSANIQPYFGGTLFEAFAIRNMIDEYRQFADKYELDTVEISDGTMEMNHDEKCKYIASFKKDFQVLSEVGSKLAGKTISNEQWVEMMNKELDAGAWKVIAEARESGNIGIYNSDGSSNVELINYIKAHVDTTKIMWEAPAKSQQTWFIKQFGNNVNLGNLSTNEVIAVESLRLGLRGDTLFDFLNS